MRGTAALLVGVLVVAVVVAAEEAVKSFDGQSVYRVIPQTKEELQLLKSMAAHSNGTMDFWHRPSDVGQPVDVRVATETFAAITHKFTSAHVMIEDVGQAVQSQFDGLHQMTNQSTSFYCYDEYQSYDEIIDYLNALAADHSSIARVVSIGTTLEGRQIFALSIDIGNGNGAGKRAIHIDGGIHAREWIAPAVALNILLSLLEGYRAGDADAVELLGAYNVTVVPVLNVDGYVFTWESDRMWRKTRRPNPGGSYGVDMNRNADVDWCANGASTVPSSDTYCGPYPNSEPELVHTIDYIVGQGGAVLIYWNLHSYGQEIIVPYAYSPSAVPPDRDDHLAAGQLFWQGIRNTTGLNYDGPRRPNSVYSGFLMDAVYLDAAVKYSGLIELRDTGQFGFLLPESQICDNSEEIYNGFKAHAFYAIDNQ